MKKILIVDDSTEVREYLAKLLLTIDGIQLVGEASDYISAINNFERLKPDTVILDVDLSIGNGIEALVEIKNINQDATVIMYTNYTNNALKSFALKHGADFYLDKSSDIDRLTEILTELAD